MAPWIVKANRIVSELCLDAYRKANIRPDGTRYARHRPYAVPQIASDLVECIGTGDEHRAKAIMLYRYGMGVE